MIKLQVFSIPQFSDNAKTKRKKNRILSSTGNADVYKRSAMKMCLFTIISEAVQ